MHRRLMAILAADMVGYSRLVELDEAGTLARLKTHRLELVDPAITKTNGRIVKTTGDGMLVEFASATDAVECAVEIQRRMARRNADVEPERQIRFRIGINLGDVIVEDGDVLGDGVNIAARLQTIADAGGIAVSQAVRDELAHKLDLTFEDLGEQPLKNISRPLRVYRVMLDEAQATPVSAPALGDGGATSIAVLPFANMSGDPDQEFFADGLTEDIITALSRFRDLLVISRNSTFVYKGKAVNVQDVAKAFGVQYVVEGSVRKIANRVRITVQLIDARTDRHVWAERYDRELADIFAMQDEVTSSIVATLSGRVEAAAVERVQRSPTSNMRAYEYVLTAKVLHHRSTVQANAEAQRMIEKAIELDPKYAHAHAWRGCIVGQSWVYNWCPDRDTAWNTIVAELATALSLDDNDSDVHRILAAISLSRGDHEAARYHQERALALNPNNDLIVVQQGEYLTWVGKPEEGVEWIHKAMRLNPHHPERFWNHLGRAYFVARRYPEAIESFRHISKPDQFHLAFLAAAAAMAGDPAAADSYRRQALALDASLAVEAYLATLHYKRTEDAAHHREALIRAGLPQ
ncbi:adenylate/guanylate cyclase domain-containing protein [Nordella sp. HKS 07]|uniref:adenylate/guanylate cyclase domain-containing protein n=1 Tax=Nordella sp. HKS 07 TaxID=2712222 RepID=UPI0013E1AB7C|nr:adenylate/guanylate cyclase domain-containing protein [Nordella sp. HKS 07]QIG52625.1 adenylate/guanylate cyclase domain-containing protein [Nordella sp. HKS 07]